MTASESLPGGWTNPYRYDGWHRVRYDSETGLYWMSVRAYDPTLGRFLSRDPLNRQPLVFTGQPYVYAGNNPLKNVDPSGQLYFTGDGGGGSSSPSTPTSVQPTGGTDPTDSRDSGCDHSCRVSMAKDVANEAAHNFNNDASIAQLIGLGLGAITLVTEGVGVIADAVPGLEWLGITIGVIGLDVGVAALAATGLYLEANFIANQFSYNAGWNSDTYWSSRTALEGIRSQIFFSRAAKPA